MDWLLGRRGRIAQRNAGLEADYADSLREWSARKESHERRAAEWYALLTAARAGEPAAMEKVLEQALSEIVWPKETDVAFDFGGDASTLATDVDLPDEDDMPRKVASVAARGIKVQFKQRSDAQVRRDFVHLAHGTLFRVTGEAFTVLPTLREVTVSGYVQRLDAGTGTLSDAYVLSARVDRERWLAIDFSQIGNVDPVAAFDRFELVRSIDRSSSLRAITPLIATAS